MSVKHKKVIFICVGNSCRSQMAEGFAKHYVCQRALDVEIHSAGTRPAGYVHADAITVMRERGIDIASQHSKGIPYEELGHFDYIITMGCLDADACRGATTDWGIPDPIGRGVEFYRNVRNMIEEKVVDMLDELQRL